MNLRKTVIPTRRTVAVHLDRALFHLEHELEVGQIARLCNAAEPHELAFLEVLATHLETAYQMLAAHRTSQPWREAER